MGWFDLIRLFLSALLIILAPKFRWRTEATRDRKVGP